MINGHLRFSTLGEIFFKSLMNQSFKIRLANFLISFTKKTTETIFI